jgi:hypothetical protein
MVNITLSVPEELKRKMEEFPEINWSEIARRSIIERVELLEKMNKLLSKSKLTEEDALRFGKEVNKSVSRKFREAA